MTSNDESADATETRTERPANRERGISRYREIVGWRFYRYGTDAEGEPLFSFWADVAPQTGVCIFERGDGTGRWLDTHHYDDDYPPTRPSRELGEVLKELLLSDDGVEAERVESLPDHERYFVQSIIGTLEEGKHLPTGVWAFLEHCAEHPLLEDQNAE